VVEPVGLEAMQTRITEAQEVLGQHPRLPDHLLHAPVAVEAVAGPPPAMLRGRAALVEAVLEATVLLPLEQARLILVVEVAVVATQATRRAAQAVQAL